MFAKLKRQTGEGGAPGLVERHFVMQDELPNRLREVEIESLDPFLRSLLFTDGTVTRALGVHVLDSVAVGRISQVPVPTLPDVAHGLEAPPDEELIRRQVSIGIGSPSIPVLWAESFMVPDRLPPGFLGLLDGAPDGIGQSLQRFSLESSRELCWFGMDSVPEWAPGGRAKDGETLCRLYRIISDGQPAILIFEYFAVERRSGAYHLSGVLSHEARRHSRRRVG